MKQQLFSPLFSWQRGVAPVVKKTTGAQGFNFAQMPRNNRR
jgi:hypothetical protein